MSYLPDLLPKDLHCLLEAKYGKAFQPFLWNFIRSLIDPSNNLNLPILHIRYFLDRLLEIEESPEQRERFKALRAKLTSPELINAIVACRKFLRMVRISDANDSIKEDLPQLDAFLEKHFKWTKDAFKAQLSLFLFSLTMFVKAIEANSEGTKTPRGDYSSGDKTLRFFANDNVNLSEHNRWFRGANYLKLSQVDRAPIEVTNLGKNFREDSNYQRAIRPELYNESHDLMIKGGFAVGLNATIGILLFATGVLTIPTDMIIAICGLTIALIIGASILGIGIYKHFQAKATESWIDEQLGAWYAIDANEFDENEQIIPPDVPIEDRQGVEAEFISPTEEHAAENSRQIVLRTASDEEDEVGEDASQEAQTDTDSEDDFADFGMCVIS